MFAKTMKNFLIACLFLIFAILIGTSTGSKKTCGCRSEKCYGNSSGNPHLYNTYKIGCLSGFRCKVVYPPCETAFGSPSVVCHNACDNIICPGHKKKGEGCKLVRARGHGERYYNVPICGANPCDSTDCITDTGVGSYCQLKIVGSCTKPCEPCEVKVDYCAQPCIPDPCKEPDQFCYPRQGQCPVGPCRPYAKCRKPCEGVKCKPGEVCEVMYTTCQKGVCPPEAYCDPRTSITTTPDSIAHQYENEYAGREYP